jgi:signal transduction histidine kinase
VKQFLRTGRTEEAEKHLDQLAGAAREVYADVRESIIGLRSAAVPGRSVTDALQEYVNTWEAYAGVDCRLLVQGEPRLTPNAQLQVLRIVQESLANIRKHAGARRVDVTLEQGDTRLQVTIQDDGAGFTPDALGRAELPRFGLSTMRERAESLGGAFLLESSPGAGTRVTVELPTQPPPNP